ncbi:serine carboxypeptidase-domain-containing protein [Mycena epipterygia]|nr:serine carboxypeptidase-domain-containing protein [Mycena epipterygia]
MSDRSRIPPVGVGFSYGSKVNNSRSAALSAYEFLQKFFRLFPHLSQNKLILSGGLYGGMHVPHIATVIHEQNITLAVGKGEPGAIHVNLESMMVSNLISYCFRHALVKVFYSRSEPHPNALRNSDLHPQASRFCQFEYDISYGFFGFKVPERGIQWRVCARRTLVPEEGALGRGFAIPSQTDVSRMRYPRASSGRTNVRWAGDVRIEGLRLQLRRAPVFPAIQDPDHRQRAANKPPRTRRRGVDAYDDFEGVRIRKCAMTNGKSIGRGLSGFVEEVGAAHQAQHMKFPLLIITYILKPVPHECHDPNG